MKITLFALNSSFTHTNLAVRYLASALDESNVSCDILEFTLKDSKSYLLHSLVAANSDIYGFSVYIWNLNQMLEYAAELKKLRPDCHIIFGGPEVSFEDESFFERYPFVDTIIKGEGEAALVSICKNPQNHRKVIVNASTDNRFINEGILYDKYPSEGDILYYESSRGCPHRCSYCLSALSKNIRAKDAKTTIGDLLKFEKLPKKPRVIKFIDRTFNYDLERAKEIWRALLSDEFTLNYHFEITADALDEESFEILSKMPKGKLQFEAGIQSTNTDTLSAVNRRTDPQKAIDNLARLKAFGNIHIHADLIVGLPFEGRESFKKSFDDTIKCCHKLQVGFLKLLKGSVIRDKCNDHSYIYESTPPYTVLANDYMSYEEIYRLNSISETVDRYYSSDNFRHTMNYITEFHSSPFDFFSALTDASSEQVKKMSQHQCRMTLTELLKMEFGNSEPLQRLALDTLIYENKKPPRELCDHFNEITEKDTKNIITANLENCKGNERNSWNVYEFPFDKDNYYIIDRTKHILIKQKRHID